jgi:hypothetical protein
MTDKKIVAYETVSAHPDSLADRVNELIAKGWQPLGGPVAASSSYFYQAVVRYKKPEGN